MSQVKIEPTDRYLEPLSSGYRAWIRYRVPKRELAKGTQPEATYSRERSAAPLKYMRATLLLTAVPQPEKIIVTGEGGERVIEVSSNPQQVELREGDHSVRLRLVHFKDAEVDLGTWKHGQVIERMVTMEQEF